MPSFSNSQMGKVRPSIQSVKQSNRKIEMSLLQMNEEISEMASSRHHERALRKEPTLNSRLMRDAASPRVLVQDPSMTSLVTEMHNH